MLDDYTEVEELLGTRRNESIQIGYRIAHLLGHDAVYGFDEQPSAEEPNYFPMGEVQKFAAANGQMPLIEGLIASVQARVAEEERKQAEQSIAESLIPHNDPDLVDSEHFRLYYSLIAIGDGNSQLGAYSTHTGS